MNPAEKGWLKKYMNYRKRFLTREDYTLPEYLDLEPGEFLYRLLQPTGLIYGHPIRILEKAHPRENEWDENGRVKVLMAESFIQCGLYLYPPPQNSEDQIELLYTKTIQDVKSFYHHTFEEYQQSDSPFRRKRSDVSRLEYILDQRIALRRRMRNFWTGFFHNSLIFLDLVFFLKWAEADPSFSRIMLLRERETIRMAVLKVIAASANADQVQSPEEKALFNFFLESASLPQSMKQQASEFWDKKLKITDIDFSVFNLWVLKKFALEISLLTLRADLTISQEELQFLERMTQKLGLDQEELSQSLLSIEDFIDEYKPRVHYLQRKQIYRLASERYTQSLRLMIRKNRRRISQEISESKELVALLAKSRKESLTPEEKEKVRKQLLDILKTIPTFTIFMLPGGSITLPLLLKILPKKALYPSSFYED